MEARPEFDPVTSGLPSGGRVQQVSALVLIFAPLAGSVGAAVWAWEDGVSWVILALAGGMYLVTGHGLSVGFHRMLAHRSFRPNRAVKIALAIAGSMAIEGSVFTWVAQHRRHHLFADSAGDPHSPWRVRTRSRPTAARPVARPCRLVLCGQPLRPGALDPRSAR